MRQYVSVVGLSLAFAFGGVAVNPELAENASPAAANMKRLVDDNTSFALDFYRQLRPSEGNLFFSPYSISTALALVYGGARGETEKQMAKTLHFSLIQNDLHPAFGALQSQLNEMQRRGGFKLLVANSLWPQQDYRVLDTYLSLAKERYATVITPLDYQHAAEAARQQINLWVQDKTEQKIKDLLQPGILTESTRLVLINAIYFNGRWLYEFDPRQTLPSPFLVPSQKTILVPTMAQMVTAPYGESDTLQILSLPYVRGGLSMHILLPKNKTDGLPALEEGLSVDTLTSWTGRLRPRRVYVMLPKFTMTRQFLLNEVFQNMGMSDVFRFPVADLSGLTGTRDLFLGAVIHKAFVEVDEKGTEAAAATAATVTTGSAMSMEPPEPAVVFRADHPFLFLIQDNATSSILFLGRLTDPTQAGR